MSDDLHRAIGRKSIALNRARKKLVAAKRSEWARRLNDRAKEGGRESINRDKSVAASPFQGTPRYVGTRQKQKYELLEELHRIKDVKPNRRRFGTKLIAMSLALYLISTTAYAFLRNFVPLPSRQTLQTRTSVADRFRPELMENMLHVKEIVDNYRQNNSETNGEIHGIIAVDAIAFDRELVVSKSGLVTGSLSSEVLDAETLAKIQTDFEQLENLWREKYKTIISDAFVYQFHPLSPELRPFIVHIRPTTQGKATNEEVEILEKLSNILNENGVKVLGYAMDGDSTYRKLHNLFYEEYNSSVRQDCAFTNFSAIRSRLMVSDPLHILKRARYRLLNSDVHTGLTNSSDVIDVEKLKKLLNLTSKVFSNQKFTKMHDDLPISLFSFESLITITTCEPAYVSYFLPFCLLNIGLSEEHLSLEERVNLFEVAFYYILIYRAVTTTTPVLLPEHKSARNTHVRLFPDTLSLELCNTLFSILSIIYSHNCTIHLNRIGTNPLEHTFGAIRMRSRYKNTYEKMLKSVGEMETWKRMVSILGTGGKISGRRSYYGRMVNVNLSISPCVLPMNPREIAVVAHLCFSMPVSAYEIDCWNMNSLGVFSNEIFNNFLSTLTSIYRRLHPMPKSVVTNSRSIQVTSGQNILCQKGRRDAVM